MASPSISAHHDVEPEVWIKMHERSSGLASVTPAQALDVALCWGWIDGIRKGFELNRQNLFALVWRTNAMRTPAGGAKKRASLCSGSSTFR